MREMEKEKGLHANTLHFNTLLTAYARGKKAHTSLGILSEMWGPTRTKARPDTVGRWVGGLSLRCGRCHDSDGWMDGWMDEWCRALARGMAGREELIGRSIFRPSASASTGDVQHNTHNNNNNIGIDRQVTYNILINACANEGKVEAALKLAGEMKARGIRYDKCVYVVEWGERGSDG